MGDTTRLLTMKASVLHLSFLIFLLSPSCRAQSHWGAAVTVNPNLQVAMDEYEASWLKGKQAFAFGAELLRSALPSDSSSYDRDFGYPTLAFGLRYSLNHHVTMHRDESWGKDRMVDYYSRLGNTLTAYATFARPLLRSRHWEADYALGLGLGYASHIYNKVDCIDNELIGSHLSVYFTGGLHLTYHPVAEWGVRLGADFCHHSNGALARPNKGANALGPTLAVVYTPYYKAVTDSGRHRRQSAPYAGRSRHRVDVSVGVGGKTLLEEWQLTQYSTPVDASDYRKEHFTFYMAYSAHARWMYRYARRWASGIGADVNYGTYAHRVETIARERGDQSPVSPWSLGLSANHAVFYHQLSLQMALGCYLHRQMGAWAKVLEQPYYERIGLYYTPLRADRITVGISLNAHRTKADLTELVVGYNIL